MKPKLKGEGLKNCASKIQFLFVSFCAFDDTQFLHSDWVLGEVDFKRFMTDRSR